MRHIFKGVLFGLLALLVGCASVAPTSETYTSYRIYNVSADYTLTQVRDAVVQAAKEANNNAAVMNGLPPHPLPEKPGRFAIKNMQMGPMTMQFPQMPGSTVSISSNKRASNSESMNWVIGIYPYEDGYSVQMVMVARYSRGTSSFNPIALGAALGRELAYKQDGGIEGRIKYWFDDLNNKITQNVNMKLEEAYPQG